MSVSKNEENEHRREVSESELTNNQHEKHPCTSHLSTTATHSRNSPFNDVTAHLKPASADALSPIPKSIAHVNDPRAHIANISHTTLTDDIAFSISTYRTRSKPSPHSSYSSPTTATMKYAITIFLTLTLIIIFCCIFGWCLFKICRRAIDAEHHELLYQRDVEAQVVTGSGGGGSKK
ncbi:hypothetical protein BDW02DRAFT_582052 [Decorospora gaudefroyi]|uniref:Uncharacterized protein n=1 Tax=Decorospora gaudefroyi TaxID=184978 RepID=A0A6A5K3U7_9PLEO|nr:hypothetical protein BDW02DRAFT_582052 [Decorospora gaudefroyi]